MARAKRKAVPGGDGHGASSPSTGLSPQVQAHLDRLSKRRQDLEGLRAIQAGIGRTHKAIWSCTWHSFPTRFQEFVGTEKADWVDRIDPADYARRWVQETMVPAVSSIKQLEIVLGTSCESMIRLPIGQHRGALHRDRCDVMHALFVRLYASQASASEVERIAEELAAILAEDREWLRVYHMTFEALAGRFEQLARKIEANSEASPGEVSVWVAREGQGPADNSTVAAPAQRPRRKGRPVSSDPADDRRIAELYKQRGFRSNQDAAAALGRSVSEIKLARERHRYRTRAKTRA